MGMRVFWRMILGLAGVAVWGGCELINPEEPVPGYIEVEPFELSTNPATQGSRSARITEVWVSSGTDFLGAYRLPALIPVLAAGQKRITLQAGIKDNGISALPEIYPFYAPVEIDVDFQPNQSAVLRPVTGYLPETRFAFIEDFEGAEHIFRSLRTGGPNQAMQRSTEAPFEGQASGLITLDSANMVVEIATLPMFRDLNSVSPFVYLEMDYKSEVAVSVGLVGFESGGPVSGTPVYEAGFLPREEWNKIYFNFSQLIFTSRFEAYQVVLLAAIPVQNGVPARNTARIWIDNVKLVHF